MNKSKNEIFAEKLEKLIISEVEEKVEKLKGLNVLEVTLKLTSKDLYKYISFNLFCRSFLYITFIFQLYILFLQFLSLLIFY